MYEDLRNENGDITLVYGIYVTETDFIDVILNVQMV